MATSDIPPPVSCIRDRFESMTCLANLDSPPGSESPTAGKRPPPKTKPKPVRLATTPAPETQSETPSPKIVEGSNFSAMNGRQRSNDVDDEVFNKDDKQYNGKNKNNNNKDVNNNINNKVSNGPLSAGMGCTQPAGAFKLPPPPTARRRTTPCPSVDNERSSPTPKAARSPITNDASSGTKPSDIKGTYDETTPDYQRQSNVLETGDANITAKPPDSRPFVVGCGISSSTSIPPVSAPRSTTRLSKAASADNGVAARDNDKDPMTRKGIDESQGNVCKPLSGPKKAPPPPIPIRKTPYRMSTTPSLNSDIVGRQRTEGDILEKKSAPSQFHRRSSSLGMNPTSVKVNQDACSDSKQFDEAAESSDCDETATNIAPQRPGLLYLRQPSIYPREDDESPAGSGSELPTSAWSSEPCLRTVELSPVAVAPSLQQQQPNNGDKMYGSPVPPSPANDDQDFENAGRAAENDDQRSTMLPSPTAAGIPIYNDAFSSPCGVVSTSTCSDVHSEAQQLKQSEKQQTAAATSRKSAIVLTEFVGDTFTFLDDFESGEQIEAATGPLEEPVSSLTNNAQLQTHQSPAGFSEFQYKSVTLPPKNKVNKRPPPTVDDYKRMSVGRLEALAAVSNAFSFLDFGDVCK